MACNHYGGNCTNIMDAYAMSMYGFPTKKGPAIIQYSFKRNEDLNGYKAFYKNLGLDKIVNDIDAAQYLQGEMNKFYESKVFEKYVSVSKKIGKGLPKKVDDLSINALMRDAAAYYNTETGEIGASDKPREGFEKLKRTMPGVSLDMIIFLAFIHETEHSLQTSSVYAKGRTYTELDVEKQIYTKLVAMAKESKGSEKEEYLNAAKGVLARYNSLRAQYKKESGQQEQDIEENEESQEQQKAA